jgi:hypothetical protein
MAPDSRELAMTEDDLSAPLGQDRSPRRRRALRFSFSRTVVTVLGLLAIVFAAWAMIADHPFGREHIAVAPVPLLASRPGSNSDQAGAGFAQPDADGDRSPQEGVRADAPASAPPAAARTITIIDGTSGKRQEIVIPGTDNPGRTETQADGSPRRGAVAKAAPEARTPARSTPGR